MRPLFLWADGESFGEMPVALCRKEKNFLVHRSVPGTFARVILVLPSLPGPFVHGAFARVHVKRKFINSQIIWSVCFFMQFQ